MDKRFAVYIIGLPASGKTTISSTLQSVLPAHQYVTDLDELKRCFDFDRVCWDWLDRTNKEPVVPQLKEIARGAYYDRIIARIRSGHLEATDLRSRPVDRHTSDIIDPVLWDAALAFAAESIPPDASYVFEFSRGIDSAYLQHNDLTHNDVYRRAFDIIANHVAGNRRQSVILHVVCSLPEVLRRNELRRSKGLHYVAIEVMRRCYSHDPFGAPHSYRVGRTQVQVIPIDTTQLVGVPAGHAAIRQVARAVDPSIP